MKLTKKLAGYLYNAFRKDASAHDALNIESSISLDWSVADRFFTLKYKDSQGDRVLTVDLTGSAERPTRLLDLRDRINAAAPVVNAAPAFSARVMNSLETHHAVGITDGDGIGAYDCTLAVATSPTWLLLDSYAGELHAAKTSIASLTDQMAVNTAGDDLLDEHGEYYGVRRRNGERDYAYGQRIIYEILKPKNNNIAIEEAIKYAMGRQFSVTVDDVVPPTVVYRQHLRDGSVRFDGTMNHQPVVTTYYCQFDVTTKIDLISDDDIPQSIRSIAETVDRFKAAGTQLRKIDAGGALEDRAVAVSDSCVVDVNQSLSDSLHPHLRDGTAQRNATITFGVPTEVLSTGIDLGFSESEFAAMEYGRGLCPRNGSVLRTGRRGVALDEMALTIRVSPRYSGKIPRSGVIRRDLVGVWSES